VIDHFVDARLDGLAREHNRPRLNGAVANDVVVSGNGLDLVTLASTTEGYSVNDLKDLTLAATQQSIIRSLKDNASAVGTFATWMENGPTEAVVWIDHGRFRHGSSCFHTHQSSRSHSPEIISRVE
jgi:hypothetical protein